jgi:hypothetical protein
LLETKGSYTYNIALILRSDGRTPILANPWTRCCQNWLILRCLSKDYLFISLAYAEKEKEWYLVKEGKGEPSKTPWYKKTKDQKKKKKKRQYLIMCTYLIL